MRQYKTFKIKAKLQGYYDDEPHNTEIIITVLDNEDPIELARNYFCAWNDVIEIEQ